MVARQNGFDKLFVCRPDGRDLHRLTPQLGHQAMPCYSADLQRVFYVRYQKSRYEICSVGLDGDDFKLEVSLQADALYPDVSSDGKRILLSTNLWGAMELAEFDRDSRTLHRLTYDQTINTFGKYSPDGESILFQSLRTGHPELFLYHKDGPGFEQITDSGFGKGSGSWSPDGKRIVSTEALPPKFRSVLFEIDLASGKKRYLLPKSHNVSHASYSPDGTHILFIEQETLYTFDPADTRALPFPIRGNLKPSDAIWVSVPLP